MEIFWAQLGKERELTGGLQAREKADQRSIERGRPFDDDAAMPLNSNRNVGPGNAGEKQ